MDVAMQSSAVGCAMRANTHTHACAQFAKSFQWRTTPGLYSEKADTTRDSGKMHIPNRELILWSSCIHHIFRENCPIKSGVNIGPSRNAFLMRIVCASELA